MEGKKKGRHQSKMKGGEPSSCRGWGSTPICCPSMDLSTAVPSLEVVTMPPMPLTAEMDRIEPPWSSIVSPIWLPVAAFQNLNLRSRTWQSYLVGKDRQKWMDLKLAGFPFTASPVEVVAITESGRPRTWTPFSWPSRVMMHALVTRSHTFAEPSFAWSSLKQTIMMAQLE